MFWKNFNCAENCNVNIDVAESITHVFPIILEVIKQGIEGHLHRNK